jgi:hypothetical protein
MLFTSVLFISCEQDDVILEQQQNDKPVFHSSTFKLNKENLPDGVKKSLVASKKQLGISQDFAKSTYDSLSGFWIDETSVNHTVSGEYESYTFNIVHNDSTKLKNIFFSKELDSSYTSYLVTYDLNFIDMNDLINGNVIHKIDHIEYRKIESDFQFKSVMTVGSGNCVENIEVFNAPCSSNKHHEYGDGECNFDASDSRAASPDIFMVFLKSCGGSGGNYNDGSNSPGDGIPDYGTPGGGSTSDPSNPSDPSNNNSNPASPSDEDCIRLSNGACAGLVTSPVEPLPLITPVDQETQDFFDSLNDPLDDDDLGDYINSSDQNELRNEVAEFLIDELFSSKSKLFMIEYLTRKKADNDIEMDLVFYDFDEFVSNQNIQDLEQDYLGSMSNEEIAIYNTLSPAQKVDYLAAAKKALDDSRRIFPNSQLNSNGDAYRHSLWNALGTMSLGESLMSDLTTAHELKPHPDPIYNAGNFYKEIQMDTFNNSVGRRIGSNSWFFVSSDILNALRTGQLRKLSNLGPDDRATSMSQMVVTD